MEVHISDQRKAKCSSQEQYSQSFLIVFVGNKEKRKSYRRLEQISHKLQSASLWKL